MKADKQKRAEVLAAIERGELDLIDAIRQLRKTTGLSQRDYAKLVQVSTRIYIAFEQRRGNPTMQTLEKILAPFGLQLTARRK